MQNSVQVLDGKIISLYILLSVANIINYLTYHTLSHQNREYSEQGRQLLALTYMIFNFCSVFLKRIIVLQRN